MGWKDGMTDALVKAGIPHDRMVLACKPSEICPHTDFAVA